MRLSTPYKLIASVIIIFTALFGLLIYGLSVRDDGIEWNPYVRSISELEGNWVADSLTLNIRDGRYQCAGSGCNSFGSNGAWERHQDFWVKVTPPGQKALWLRLGLREGKLILAIGADGDPDEWNPKVVFTKAEPWLHNKSE